MVLTCVRACICVSVCYHSCGSIIHFYTQTKLRTGFLLFFNSWIFIKLLHSEVMMTFAYHNSLQHISSDPSLIFFWRQRLLNVFKRLMEYASVKGSKLFSLSGTWSLPFAYQFSVYFSVMCLSWHKPDGYEYDVKLQRAHMYSLSAALLTMLSSFINISCLYKSLQRRIVYIAS